MVTYKQHLNTPFDLADDQAVALVRKLMTSSAWVETNKYLDFHPSGFRNSTVPSHSL